MLTALVPFFPYDQYAYSPHCPLYILYGTHREKLLSNRERQSLAIIFITLLIVGSIKKLLGNHGGPGYFIIHRSVDERTDLLPNGVSEGGARAPLIMGEKNRRRKKSWQKTGPSSLGSRSGSAAAVCLIVWLMKYGITITY